jgi:hypothetical protein
MLLMHTMVSPYIHWPLQGALKIINRMSYPNIIAALSAELQRRYADADLESHRETGSVVSEIIERQGAMPDYLRLPTRMLTHIFDYWGLVVAGKRFQNLDAAGQAGLIDAWKSSRFNVCRNFVRFYESLYLLIIMQEDAR